MRAGTLRHSMTLKKPVEGTPSDTGEVPITWEKVATMWCSLEPLQGRELWAAQQVQAETTHIIRTRYRTDISITSAMRLIYGNRTFHIESAVNVDELNRSFLIRVVERT